MFDRFLKIGVPFQAETATDEVYAQLSLLPDSEVRSHSLFLLPPQHGMFSVISHLKVIVQAQCVLIPLSKSAFLHPIFSILFGNPTSVAHFLLMPTNNLIRPSNR